MRLKLFLWLTMCLFYFNGAAQTTYFISSAGSDSNDGKTVNAPWKTLKELVPGNTYLFKRGDTFNFAIDRVKNPEKKPITINSYGKGNKPLFNLYKRIRKNAWSSSSTNIWKVDLKNTENYTGFMSSNDTNVGFIKVNGQIKGNKLKQVNELTTAWDFYSDSQYLYVYSSYNPGEANTFDIATNQVMLLLSDGMSVSNLSLKGTGSHAVQGKEISNIKLKYKQSVK